jgi:hypothetical protein
LKVKDKSSGRSVTVMVCLLLNAPAWSTSLILYQVVDTCEVCTSDIALFNDGWSHLAPRGQETLNVEFEGISCGHPEPLQIQFSKDVEPTYLSLQVLNANYPVFDMWIRPSGQEEWRELRPREWNFFEGPENEEIARTADFQVDCSRAGGGVVYLENVSVQAGRSVNATGNC